MKNVLLKNCIFYRVGQGFVGSQGAEIGQKNFLRRTGRGSDRIRQNHAKREQRSHLSALPRLVAIPSNVTFISKRNSTFLQNSLKTMQCQKYFF